jgi:hypothetical protein
LLFIRIFENNIFELIRYPLQPKGILLSGLAFQILQPYFINHDFKSLQNEIQNRKRCTGEVQVPAEKYWEHKQNDPEIILK